MLRGFGDIATAQREPDGVELARVVSRHRGRPAVIAIVKLDRNFGGVFAFVDQLDGCLGHRLLRRLKSLSHKLGSGRYAVTMTAGRRSRAGMAHTT